MNIEIHFCDKYKDDNERISQILCGENPRFGYNWWLWTPRFTVDNYGEFKCFCLTWLNFWVEFRPFGKWEESEPKSK